MENLLLRQAGDCVERRRKPFGDLLKTTLRPDRRCPSLFLNCCELRRASGPVNIAGGKWTTSRNMTEDCVNQAARLAGLTPRANGTKSLNIHGHCSGGSQLEHLSVYGSAAPSIRKIIDSEPAMGDQLHPALPYCGAEIAWAVGWESARSIEDVLAHRTRALFLNAKAAAQMTPRVAQIVANELGRDKQWQDHQLVAFRALAQNYRVNESAHAGKFGPLRTTE